MIHKLNIICFIILILQSLSTSPVGYNITGVKNYKLLRTCAKSALYQIQTQGIKDGRPIKLLELVGTHHEVGYAYGKLLSNEMLYTYQKFMNSQIPKRWQLFLLQMFLDWQYKSYLVKQTPMEFIEQINGIRKGGKDLGINNLHIIVRRVLVVSSYPGDIEYDIIYALIDQFKQFITPSLKSSPFQSLLQNNMNHFVEFTRLFLMERKIKCSFFAVWGSRTVDGKLFTMRNLDWQPNTGINMNKIIFVWKIDNTIPHLTLGYPGIVGALTGMSAAGLTVHEAGLDSKKQTQSGFHWALRLRYVLMNAKNLNQAETIWRSTNNTLGMNHMIASAYDLRFAHPALVLQTMAGYTAYFRDHDARQDQTIFVDPKTKANYTAGFSMREAVFRTNHGYDPKILKNLLNPDQEYNSDSMIRYRLLKNSFNWYKNSNKLIDQMDALNITAILGDKSGEQFMVCPPKNVDGINVISVMFSPGDVKMWAAFEYGYGETFRPACCGVYLEIDMKKWFGLSETYKIE